MGGTAAGRGHMSTTYPSKVLRGDLEPAFMIDLAKKDLDIAIKFSEMLGVPISMAIQAEKIYTDAQADGRGRQDWTAIFDMLQKKGPSKS
jgi:4-hydroxybutyrate dehydrogenase/sulfolactaldehyde 3-reductase